MYNLIDSYFDISSLHKADWGCGCFIEDYILLSGVLVQLRPKKILEIGTNTGLGAVIMAKAASFMGKPAYVTTIDMDQSLGRNNVHLIPNIDRQIAFVEESSNIFLPMLTHCGERFDFIFIDGGHDYEQASKDWKNASTLSDTFAFHDTTQFLGLQQLIQEIRSSGEYDVFQFISPPGHRFNPELRLEDFSTGITLVQRKPSLADLKSRALRNSKGNVLPGHWDFPRRSITGLIKAQEASDKLVADGSTLCQLNQTDKAIVCFIEAIRLCPDNHLAYYRLGMFLLKQNDFTNSLVQLEKAYRISPHEKEIVFNYAVVLTENGQYERAKLVCYVFQKRFPEAAKEVAAMTLCLSTIRKKHMPEYS